MTPVSFARAVGVVLVASAFAALGAQQQPANLGFEDALIGSRLFGWGTAGQGFELALDSTVKFAGRLSLRSRWVAGTPYTEASRSFGVASQQFPVANGAGRKLHLAGFIRTENIQNGYAGYWMRVDGPGGAVLAFDNMYQRGVRGTTPWTRYDIELSVDSGATGIMFGLIHPGDGTAWFDSVSLEVVGLPMPRAVAAFKPEPRPAEEMTRLLTDAELALPNDTTTISENPEYAGWVKEHAAAVRVHQADAEHETSADPRGV